MAHRFGASSRCGPCNYQWEFYDRQGQPNDVDCVLLIGERFPIDVEAGAELVEGLPFLEIKLVNQDGFELLVETIFASDREMQPKGMIEVVL